MYTAAFVYLIVFDMILKVNFTSFPNALLENVVNWSLSMNFQQLIKN